jgi:hypothetical protein
MIDLHKRVEISSQKRIVFSHHVLSLLSCRRCKRKQAPRQVAAVATMSTFVYIYIYIYSVYIHTHTHTHTHIYIYIYIW